MTASLGQVRALLRDMREGAPGADPITVAARLCDDGWWLGACQAAVRDEDSWLDASLPASTDHEHPGTGTPQAEDPTEGGSLALRLIAHVRPDCLARACAVLHAAQAVRARRLGQPDEYDRQLLMATHAWNARPALGHLRSSSPTPAEEPPAPAPDFSAPARARSHVQELVHLLEHGPRPTHRSSVTPLLLDLPTGPALRTLILYDVDDPDESMAPDMTAMLFAKARGLEPSLQTAFDWIRAQEHFPRGHGVRWAVRNPGGRPVLDFSAPHPEAASAVTLARVFSPRRFFVTRLGWAPQDADARIVVHAGMTPAGTLVPPEDTAKAVAALPAGHTLLTAATPPNTGRPAPSNVRTAYTIAQAVRQSSRRLSRGRRLAAFGVVLALLAAGLSTVGATILARQDDDQRIRLAAADYGQRAVQNAVDTPRTALRNALAAQVLSPGSVAARSGLINTVDRNLKIKHLLSTHWDRITALALDRTGRYAAAIGADQRLRVWDTSSGTEITVPQSIRSSARAVAFPAVAGSLAIATSHAVMLWNPAMAHSPARVLADATGVSALAYSADGKTAAWGTRDGDVTVVGTEGHASPRVLPAAHGRIDALALDSEGDTVACGGADGSVALWSWRTADRPAHTSTRLQTPLSSLAFAGKSHLYAVGRTKLYMLSAQDTHSLHKPLNVPQGTTIAYRPQAHTLVLAGENGAKEVSEDPSDNLGRDDDTDVSSADNFVNLGTHLQSVLALSGDDHSAAVPTGEGSIAIYDTASHIDYSAQLGGIKAVHAVPGTRERLYVSGDSFRRSQITVYDTGKKKAVPTSVTEHGRLLTVTGGSAFSARHSLLAVATLEGNLLLYPFSHSRIGSPTVLDGPVQQKGSARQNGVTAFFDDESGQVIGVWRNTLIVYTLGRSSTSTPAPLYGLDFTEAISAGAISPDGAHLFLGGSRGLWALPHLGRRYSWTKRSVLSSRFILNVKPLPGGAAAAMTFSGSVGTYQQAAGAKTWTEDILVGKGRTTDVLAVGDGTVAAAGVFSLRLFDARQGQLLASLPIGSVFTEGAWYEKPYFYLFGDVAGVGAQIPLDTGELVRRACSLLKGGAAPGRVRDVWPSAPDRVKDRLLCALP
ncbi:WD40 repeat domain-containing protein [Streptomyces canus]|uniref:WD40 repeat domain-containing protein n=1 Tax=Streptomyces canus TaxID=58343 RepID=UPI0033B27E90